MTGIFFALTPANCGRYELFTNEFFPITIFPPTFPPKKYWLTLPAPKSFRKNKFGKMFLGQPRFTECGRNSQHCVHIRHTLFCYIQAGVTHQTTLSSCLNHYPIVTKNNFLYLKFQKASSNTFCELVLQTNKNHMGL